MWIERPPEGRLPLDTLDAEIGVLARAADGGFDWADAAAEDVGPHGAKLPPEPLAIRMLLEATLLEHVGREIYGLVSSYRVDEAALSKLASHLTGEEASVLGSLATPARSEEICKRLGDTERARRVLVASVISGALTTRIDPPPLAPALVAPRPVVLEAPKDRPRPTPEPTHEPTQASPQGNVAPAETGEELKSTILAKLRTLSQSTHYQALEVPKIATRTLIDDHYFKLLRKFHPDAYFGDLDDEAKSALDDVFARVNEAYEVLTRGDRREDYDRQIEEGRAVRGPISEEDLLLAKTQLDSGKRKLDEGNWLQARSALESARRLDPGNSEILGHLGKAYLEGGASNRVADKALAFLSEALENDPGRALYHVFLGDYYLTRGDRGAAARCYEKALALDKSLEQASRALDTLRGTKAPGGAAHGGAAKR